MIHQFISPWSTKWSTKKRSEGFQRDFHHPFTPYSIQLDFMTALYDCIELGKIGIFESPTGTGKSLSLACGALTWLREFKQDIFEEDSLEDDNEPDWMVKHARKEKREAFLRQREELETRLARIREKERKLKERQHLGEPQTKRRKKDHNADDEDDEDRFLLADYESDEERASSKPASHEISGLSARTQALLEKAGYNVGNNKEVDDTPDEVKIFFCSRTHSQLSQFVSELRRLELPPAVMPDVDEVDVQVGKATEAIKHISLGSRKNLCINPKVNKLGSATEINERCLELQQPVTAADHKCPHLPTKDTESLANDFRDHAIAEIRDIEDLGELGKRMGICPYYASRPAIKPSEIVTLPYPLLLQKSAREALDISVKGHVIIIDEAHNLMDAISGIHSTQVTLAQLQRSRGQLEIYLKKFNNRLKGKNRVYVAQTIRLIDSLLLYLQKALGFKKDEGSVSASDLLTGKGVDQINLFKLSRYLQESKLARKVDGYITFSEQEAEVRKGEATTGHRNHTKAQSVTSMPTLTHIQGFLVTLMNPSDEGQFFYSRNDSRDITLKYMLLDPSHHFREVAEEARAVILAGGTMSPMEDYLHYLFPYLKPTTEEFMTLSCRHVIPSTNLLALPVNAGPGNKPLKFTFSHRQDESMITCAGIAILDLINVIPDGVVAFFPSYAFLDKCLSIWRKWHYPKTDSTLLVALERTKPVFHESRTDTSNNTQSKDPSSTQSKTESILAAYTTAVREPPKDQPHRGALLLAVIGGSLSEGINFSDDLGRGVLVIGLPFPNPNSAEWQAKASYIAARANGNDKPRQNNPPQSYGDKGGVAVKEHAENVCMRAVNQCIGRAIRHKDDYAVVVLLDDRYAAPRIKDKLPSWMRASLGGKENDDWKTVTAGVRDFFIAKTSAENPTHNPLRVDHLDLKNIERFEWPRPYAFGQEPGS